MTFRLLTLCAVASLGCRQSSTAAVLSSANPPTSPTGPVAAQTGLIVGADVSSLPAVEAAGSWNPG